MSPTQEMLQWFSYDHLPSPLKEVSREFALLAYELAETVQESRETTAGLRKLLEAKDCFVRAVILNQKYTEKV